MLRPILLAPLALASTCMAGGIQAFYASPATNSADWTLAADALGARLCIADFAAHPVGPVVPDFYLSTMGFTMQLVGGVYGSVQDSAGAMSGSVVPPLSEGEGLRPYGRDIVVGGSSWTVTVDFAEPVGGFGTMTGDVFNPFNDNAVTVKAFDGPSGTGRLLGQASALPYCFQLNWNYFLGLVDPKGRIRSVTISCPGLYGDGVFLEDFRVARLGVVLPAADLNHDCVVDAADLAMVLGAWGANGTAADLDGNGTVGAEDLALLLGAWS